MVGNMSKGLNLIAATIDEGGNSGIARLKRELFIADEMSAFEFLMNHYVCYGETPSYEMFQEHGIQLPVRTSHNFNYCYDQVIERSKYNLYNECVPKIDKALRNRNIESCDTYLRELINNLGVFHSNRQIYDSDHIMTLMLETYQQTMEMRLNGIPTGIFSGWEPLDLLVHGYRPGDLIVFAGRRGSGKSYILAKQALRAIVARKRVLFVSKEMQALQVANRLAAIHLGLNPDQIITGNLSRENYNRLVTTVEHFNQYPLRTIESNFSGHVTDIIAQVNEFRPDIVFIDGSYLIKPDKHYGAVWEQQANTHQDLKTRIALDCNIPLVCSVQQNRASKKMRDGDGIVAGSDVIEQLASVLVSISKLRDNQHRRLLNIVKNRDGEEGLFVINYIFNRLDMSVNEDDTRRQREIVAGANRRHTDQNFEENLRNTMT